MKKFNYLLILFIFIKLTPLQSQDLYDLPHSLKFAGYLFNNGEYSFAAKEYYRLFVTTNFNDSIAEKLGRSLFLSKQYDILRNTFNNVYGNDNIPCHLNTMYIKSLIVDASMPISSAWINGENCLSPQEKDYFSMTNMLLHNNYEEAHQIYSSKIKNQNMKKYEDIFAIIDNTRYKKVWASVAMSAIIPGSGKAYCGYWKDGLFSFLMFGLSSWQAYSGFHKKGVKSAYGWINGGIALAFYSGNIYGSIKSANQYNHQINHNIHHEAKRLFLLPD